MGRLISALNLLLPVLYGGTLALYVRHFINSDGGERFWGSRVFYGILFVHAIFLVLLGADTGHFPIANKSEFFSLLALSVGATYALAERWHREANTGVFFIAIVFVFELASAWMTGDPGTIPERSRDPIYGIHVIFTVSGFAGLTVSSLYALMYVLLNRQLKSRKLGLIFRQLPPLSMLEKMSKLATTTGVILLGVGLVLGHYVAIRQFGYVDVFQHPIIVVADLAWLAYVIGIVVVRTKGLSGVRMGYLSLGGYLLFMASLVIVLTRFGAFHTFS